MANQKSTGGFSEAGKPQVQQASPEEQDNYDRFVANSLMMLYNKEFTDKALEMIESAPSTAEGIARVGTAVASRVYLGARKKGAEVSWPVVVHGGAALTEEIGSLAREVGIDVTDEDMETGYYMGADMFRRGLEGAGMIDMSHAQAEAQEYLSQVSPEEVQRVQSRIEGARKAQMGRF